MDERELREWITQVKDGALSRREFTRMLAGLGWRRRWPRRSSPRPGFPAGRPPRPSSRPPAAGGGGELKVLWWQGPTILNPHLSIGVKDGDGSRIFYEPLISFDPEGNFVPVLAAEVPTLQNGGVARDGLSVTWKIKRNVQWHDGKPLTADDFVFTWEYAADPATTAISAGHLQGRRPHREARHPHVQDRLQGAEPGLVPDLRRDALRHPEARLRAVQGGEVPRGAGEPQAGRDRPLPDRRLQARGPDPGRAEPELPRGELALLRPAGAQGRRRRRLGGPRRHPDG